MALARESIAQAKELISTMRDCSQTIGNGYETALNELHSDENYQLFKEGTTIGSELDQTLQSLIKIIESMKTDQIDQSIEICSTFIEVQENINNSINNVVN